MSLEYRTKPIHVEALQWSTDQKWTEQPHWLFGAIDCTHNRTQGKIHKIGNRLQVATAHGTVVADSGD